MKDTRDCANQSTYELNEDDYNLLKQCRLGVRCDKINDSGKRLLALGFLVEIDNKLLSIVCEDLKYHAI